MSDYLGALFRRRPNQGWFTAGRYDVTTVDLICLLAVASMFVYGFSQNAFYKLAFSAPLVREFEVWRLVTWPIATFPDLWGVLGIVFFWLFGQQLEALFGRNKFVVWVLSVTLIPAILLTFLGTLGNSLDVSSAEFGLSTLFLGGIWVYAATYPGVKWFEVIPLWAIAAVFTMLNLLQYSGSRAMGAIVFLLTSVAASLFMGRSLGLATGWPIPHLPLAEVGSGSPRTPKPKKQRRSRRSKGSSSRGTVVDGPWQQPGSTLPPPPGPPTSAADQAEMDALLDKISADGIEALSTTEKKRLNELSKRLRDK